MMLKDEVLVIDTNVAIVANGKSDHASVDCEIACVDLIGECSKHNIALDDGGLIMAEYQRHLSHSGQPGLGDVFFKYLHDNQYAQEKVKLYAITRIDNDNRSFEELPENTLDPSDRKMLATAVVASGGIVNATDSDWAENSTLLEELNIDVHQLCPEHCVRTN